MTKTWSPASTAPEGIVVMTKIDDAQGKRNVQALKRRGNLWFIPDDSMYVYYTPTHWLEREDDDPCPECGAPQVAKWSGMACSACPWTFCH